MTTGAAYAQSVPTASGTVTCLQVATEEAVTTVTYPVDWSDGSYLVANRWGPGEDQDYVDGYGFTATSKKFTTLTMYFYAKYTPTYLMEDDYFETGVWEVRYDKNYAVTAVTGKSYILRDTPFGARYAGECTWALKGN